MPKPDLTGRPCPASSTCPTCHVGVDMGATLAKVAIDDGEGKGETIRFELLPSDELGRVAELVGSMNPSTIGLTGGGAAALSRRLLLEGTPVDEFAAWGSGATQLLRRSGDTIGRFLLVSLGTGTSVLLVDGMSVSRIGGTALGGGTVLGLGYALLGIRSFEELCELAGKGRRAAVDLMVSDIYRPGEIPLMGDLTAASFGKLARTREDRPEPEDLAAGIMGLVGENVALICAGLAAAAQVPRIVLGGSTLRANQRLESVLTRIMSQLGRDVTVLANGEFAGAFGALELARLHRTPANP